MAPKVGDRLGPYRLERQLGRGGMGEVFLGRHLETGAQHAVKVLALVDPEAAQRFRREGEAMARLEGHPNVVQVHSCSVDRDVTYLAMELVDGQNLEERLRAGPLPPDQAARLIEEVARGLALAHAAGVLHRDLKPANVLLARDGTPKLADFGLARLHDAASLTETGTVMGSPNYMAPEQANGQTSGPAADVYGLGATLYAALTGRPPVEGSHLLSVLAQVVEGDPIPIRQLEPTVPPALEAICHRCLAKSPQDRYPTVAAMADALATLDPESPPAKDRPRWPAAVALGLCLVVALWIASQGLGSRPDPEQTPAPTAEAPPRPTTDNPSAAPRIDEFAAAWSADPHQAAKDLAGLRELGLNPTALHRLLDLALERLIRTSPESTDSILALGSKRYELLGPPPAILPAFRRWVHQRVVHVRGMKAPPPELLLAGLRSDAILSDSSSGIERSLLSGLDPSALRRLRVDGSRAVALLSVPRARDVWKDSRTSKHRALIAALVRATRTAPLADLGPRNHRLAVYLLVRSRLKLATRLPTGAAEEVQRADEDWATLPPLERDLQVLHLDPEDNVDLAIAEALHLLKRDEVLGRDLVDATRGRPAWAKIFDRAIDRLKANARCADLVERAVQRSWPKKSRQPDLLKQLFSSHLALGAMLQLGARPSARAALRRALELAHGYPQRETHARCQLALLHFDQSDPDGAERALGPVLERVLRAGEPPWCALAVNIARARKQPQEAERRLTKARTVIRRRAPGRLAEFERLLKQKRR